LKRNFFKTKPLRSKQSACSEILIYNLLAETSQIFYTEGQRNGPPNIQQTSNRKNVIKGKKCDTSLRDEPGDIIAVGKWEIELLTLSCCYEPQAVRYSLCGSTSAGYCW
jgi:hypothetical protein